MKIEYTSHRSVMTEDLLIDTYMTDNPKCDINPEDIKYSIICATQDHPDHPEDAFQIAEDTSAVIPSVYGLAAAAEKEGVEAEIFQCGEEKEF